MEHDPNGTHQVLLSRHLREGVAYEYNEVDEFRIEPARDVSKYLVRAGDVLFMSRGARNLAWAIEAVPERTIVTVSFYLLRPRHEIASRYLAWYLNQPPAQATIDQIRTGAGTPIVQRPAFERLEIAVPDLTAQRTIGDLAGLQARERELTGRLAELTERSQAATGRHIIENLRRDASRWRTE